MTTSRFERYGEMYGHDLTREDFRAAVEQMTGISTGVYPDLNYVPDDHFGADQAHVIQADCDTASTSRCTRSRPGSERA